MTVHDDIESMIDVYLAGGLDDAERRDVEEHAASCDACARILRDGEAFHGWVKGSSAAGAPPTGLEDRIIANLRAATPGARRWPRSPRLVRLMIGAAAVFALILIGGKFTNDETSLLQGIGAARSRVEDNLAVIGGGTLKDSGKSLRGVEAGDTFAGYKSNIERGWQSLYGATTQSVPGEMYTTFATGTGGGAGGERRRESLKNLADKTPAPLTAAAEEPAEESDRDAFAGEKKSLAEGLERREQGQRPDSPPVVDDRKIIRNADLHLEVEKYDDAYKAIGEITRAKKGFIAGASTTKLANGKIRATVTLRIPPEQFEATLAELGKLGTPRHQAISTS
ncbi:MAG TPA: DUF4349 domain-containing protein, partial [Planctomycetota bacterium]|nr:DUF4349 domain-containing protein [Planctomycetota bacterium]